MNIAVLSGKGGAGKTLIAVNLAAAAGHAVYVDCDVEEPNGRLFLKPDQLEETEVSTLLPVFDPDKCTGCRKCVDFCRFHALIYIKEKPMVFTEVCHSCGGCAMVCPEHAIAEQPRAVGHLEQGFRGELKAVTGVLNPGEASGVPVIQQAMKRADRDINVIDCPPGSACSVQECVRNSDYCLLVAEPTAFGFHNFCMVHQLAAILHKPCGVVINKMEQPYAPLEDYCKEQHLPVLARIPFRQEIGKRIVRGEILTETVPEAAELFRKILKEIGGAVQ